MKVRSFPGGIRLLFIAVTMSILNPSARGEGDQFLDGIGETSLIARYLFNGDLKDWSRNSLHAAMTAGRPQFVDDEQFDRVLLLRGGPRDRVRLPATMLEGTESFSIAGWVRMEVPVPGACLFDFRAGPTHRITCMPVAAEGGTGLLLNLDAGDQQISLESASFETVGKEWVHLAFVLNTADKTLSIYVNGRRTVRRPDVSMSLSDILASANENQLLIGGSPEETAPGFLGRVFDLRFYRTALNRRQIAVIHHNAISDDKWGQQKESDEPPGYRTDQPRQLDPRLTGVVDAEVQTAVGQLPHLPAFLPGRYRDDVYGPPVRVLWPAPSDNAQVLEPGAYTVEGQVPGTDFRPVATVTVSASAPPDAPQQPLLKSFPLGAVTLSPDTQDRATPFMKHRDKFVTGLADTDPNSFLFNFRDAFGQPQPEGTEPLYGWDSQTTRLRGHASGHYLTAIAQAYASTAYDPQLQARFEEIMDEMIDVLYALSQMSGKPAESGGPFNADPCGVPPGPGKSGYDSDLSIEGIRTDYWNWGEGFISGYPPDQFIMLEQGASYGGSNQQVWAPYYTLHKILAGLMDCYEVGGNPKALEVARNMGLWVYQRLNALPQDTLIQMWNSYIAGEYGGMNEAMARLFRLTGDERFLECAMLFDNTTFFFGDAGHTHGLACNVDTLRGRHANQHIPQITGALETYKGTHDPAYYRVADNFWERCSQSYMYSIGGVAGARNPNNAECFTAEPDTLFRNGLSDGGQNETCATYNLLKLGRQLFLFEPDAGYMDYYERALYNHILASVAENDAGNTYHVPLNPGAVKRFGNAEMNSFTCCNGTALESATKLQNTIYLRSADDHAVYVNLYIPSELKWEEQGIRITQETRYPYSDTVRLTVHGSGAFDLNLRIPEWVAGEVGLQFNGRPVEVEARAGSYLNLSRTWNNGDSIELRLPMDFHLMPLMDQPNIASLFYGPVLLAAEETEARTEWRRLNIDPADLSAAFKGDPSTLRFESGDIRLKPFFETYGRHSVYLDLVPLPEVTAYPPIQILDPPEEEFYMKQLDFQGIPIKSSAAVEDRALHAAYDRLAMMLANLPGVQERLVQAGTELHIIGRNEVTTDLPEWRHDKGVKLDEYNGLTRDERTRGMGGLLVSCGEENLLKLPEDRYRGSDICVHEFAHNVMYFGATPDLAEQLEIQRQRSLENGLWVDSYAGSNVREFFAELSMWYFGSRGNLAMKGPKPADGPAGLKAYDPEAYALIDAFWSGRDM